MSVIAGAVDCVSEPVLTSGDRFEHVMALHFDPQGSASRGVVRAIVDRDGRVDEPGFVDRSRLYTVAMDSPYDARIEGAIEIDGAQSVVAGLPEAEDRTFLGFEDPNLWREDGTVHLYCTIPLLDRSSDTLSMYLGHAEGPDIDTLSMTAPTLGPEPDHAGAKELAVAPLTRAGVRHNLVESSDRRDGRTYSVLRTATATDLGTPWRYGGVALHPDDLPHDWCAGHLSTGPLLPRSFVDLGPDRRVGLLNGRSATERVAGRDRFGTFAVGMMVYNTETGTVEWVSDRPLIDDPAARTITFASAFRELEDTGVIYAHVDDDSIRAYRVDPDALAALVPPAA
ncbi:hypothetical protein [Halococcoides cellulosivorans]|uniref:Uncharacterized protein n=1 Tax=Halococcoides cellulosivorans TaxID=1679096 RepID=A0A2R4X3H2_9EURY|nr:hypothetical protein [Halococcoides cellulosivorans]AWB28344.1 hypothetical protein HARCEL1_11820 [Halococcoides cellulosivorans]